MIRDTPPASGEFQWSRQSGLSVIRNEPSSKRFLAFYLSLFYDSHEMLDLMVRITKVQNIRHSIFPRETHLFRERK